MRDLLGLLAKTGPRRINNCSANDENLLSALSDTAISFEAVSFALLAGSEGKPNALSLFTALMESSNQTEIKKSYHLDLR